MDRGGDRRAHPAGAADHAVEPGVVDHLDDRRHAAALFADHPRPGAAELDLGGCVRAVAELVLEALDVDPVALAVRSEARHEEAGEAALGLREDEERVAHRRRHEPLVAGQLVLRAGAAAVQRRGDRRVGRTSEPPCFSVMPMPQSAPALSGAGTEALAVVRGGEEARLPLVGDLGLRADGGDRRVGHRDRAADAGVGLVNDMNIAARATWAPGCGSRHGSEWIPKPIPDAHQLVPRRVELDLVDPVAEAVVGDEPRRVLVRLASPSLGLLGAGERSDLATRSSAHSPPSRRSASTSTRSSAKTLWPSGAWLG